jgi:hypothetical protein
LFFHFLEVCHVIFVLLASSMLLLIELGIEIEGYAFLLNVIEHVHMRMGLGEVPGLGRMDFRVSLD